MKAVVLAALLAIPAACQPQCAGPRAELIEAPIATALSDPPADGRDFDHSEYDTLLERYADRASGRVDYLGLSKEVAQLDGYLQRLAEVDLTALNRHAQKALLINAYNAFTLKLILENYPGVESIKDLDSPWKQSRWTLGGDTISLDDIEHGLLRPTYKDPRIHFAVNCASVGCPPLADFAFVGGKIDRQLDDVTRSVLNNPRYARVDGETLYLTRVMSWYGGDFTSEGWSPRAESIPAFVARYRDDVPSSAKVEFLEYDWSLNDAATH